jgi:hypothetical protein
MPFPDSGIIDVSPQFSEELLITAESLPNYDNRDFYDPSLQTNVRDRVRETAGGSFDALIAAIKNSLGRRPYCALVRGLRFDEGNRLFVAINRAFGELVARPYEKPRAQLVHYIEPATDIASSRGGRESERLHTDTADWETPVEIISMVCVRADPEGGGRSRVLDIDTIRDVVKDRLGTAQLDMLDTVPVPWQLAAYRGGGLKWRTVLAETRVCWRRYTIDLALASNGAQLPAEMLATLDAFEEAISDAGGTIDFLMREGELLVSDNTRTIHARTPISDGPSSRLMIRSWIRTC